MNQVMIHFSILLNLFFIFYFLFSFIENLSIFKKREISKARLRLTRHVLDRKKLMRECRASIQDAQLSLGEFKKATYGYPWWTFLKGAEFSFMGEKFGNKKNNKTNQNRSNNIPN